jgi:hypothetical protein
VLPDSLSKLSAVWQRGSRTEIVMEGQDQIEAAVGVPGCPSSLSVNGRNTPFTYSSRTRLAAFGARTWRMSVAAAAPLEGGSAGRGDVGFGYAVAAK